MDEIQHFLSQKHKMNKLSKSNINTSEEYRVNVEQIQIAMNSF